MSDLGAPRRTEQKKHSENWENWVQRQNYGSRTNWISFWITTGSSFDLEQFTVIEGMMAVRGHKCPAQRLSL